MRQDVNLYTDEFMPKMQWCTFYHAAFVVLLFVCSMLFYSFEQHKQLKALKNENISLAENNKVVEEKPGETKNLMDKIVAKRNILESQINVLSSEVESKKLIKGAYESEKSMSLASAYEIFFSIAQRSDNNLSISEVAIHDGGSEVLINGYSRTREAIPDYFQRLKEEESFSFSKFGLLVIEHSEEYGLYQFTMERESEMEAELEKDLINERALKGVANKGVANYEG